MKNNNNYYIVIIMNKKREEKENSALNELFEQYGLKKTPQRWAIMMELQKSNQHPSADTIYRAVRKSFPNISYDTVNRTLVNFSELGIIEVVEGTSDVKRFEPHANEHHHFRCINCGMIIDFKDEKCDRLSVPEAIQKKATVIRKRVVLEGYCRKCRK